MHIQFLVAAHTDPEFLWRLCTRLLEAPDSAVTVQWDRAMARPSVPHQLPVDLRLTTDPCGWGNGSQLDAMLDSMRVLATKEFEWLVVLSGHDYPIRPLTELTDYLARTPHQLFLQAPEGGVVGPPSSTVSDRTYLQERYFFHYRWVPQRFWTALGPKAQRVVGGALQRVARWLSLGGKVRVQRRPRGFSPGIGVLVRHPPFTDERPCLKGSDWFVLSRPVFDDLLEQLRASPELLHHFRRTYCPNEALFHTLLLPKWGPANAGNNLQYHRFVGTRPHPEVITDRDWDTLVGSGEFFARKFDPADTALVDRIDREVLATNLLPD